MDKTEIKTPKYRVGKNQHRAFLEVETGKEYLVFERGNEDACKRYCDYLNNLEPTKELKPLSEITDVDAIEVCMIFGTKKPTIEKGKLLIKLFNDDVLKGKLYYNIRIYLQSKGYKIE